MQPRKRLTAADIMTEPVVTAEPHDGLSRIATQMQRHNIGSIVIAEKGKMLGILTERDFVRIVEQVGALLEKNSALHHMSKPVITVQSDTSAADVVKLMREKHVRHLVVLDKAGGVAGIISSRDLMNAAADIVSV
jgi:CBS-domain-containing membrane protein